MRASMCKTFVCVGLLVGAVELAAARLSSVQVERRRRPSLQGTAAGMARLQEVALIARVLVLRESQNDTTSPVGVCPLL
jgi:hypothetical protein